MEIQAPAAPTLKPCQESSKLEELMASLKVLETS